MKTSSKLILAAVMTAFLSVPVFGAEIIEDDPVAAVPAAKKTAVPAVTPKSSPGTAAPVIKPNPTQEPVVKKNEVSEETVAELKSKIEELIKTVSALKDEIKTLEEKNIETGSLAKDLELYKSELDDISVKYADAGKKISELEKSLGGIQDTVKSKIDKMSSWDDILAVLKKEISNNELEIARLKKEINSLKKQYGGGSDNVFDTIAQWPYTGFAALIISIAAFITIVAKP